MKASPDSGEQYAAHVPALHLLCNLGWNFLTTARALAMRGGTRKVLLRSRLVEVLQTRRYEYKGQWYPLSSSGIEQIVRELSALSLAEGLLPANERLYGKLALGITVTEFMPDGKKHQPTIPVVDWANPAANRWDVTEELEVLSAQGTHHRTPDLVCFVNGLPLVVIEAKRPESGRLDKAMVDEGVSQHLRNQRPDEIPQLFGYAQLLLAVSQTEARYGTTGTAAKFWARWREEEFGSAHQASVKNAVLPAAVRASLFEGKPASLASYFDALWAQPMEPTDQDRLLVALMTP
ncbi:MAG: type I restriction endonuclease subunit R, partial [Betaproteobacteria bacterium]|nr:type I restriction endonuclease subunit R [Betaproteobacteria bacterium]